MRRRSFSITTGVLALLAGLSGCQLIGPSSISQGRERYNSILQSTAMEQTMSNIVRVYQHEPTLFMDVTEVDAALSMGGSLVGAATNIGARPGTAGGTITGRLGTATGTVQYSETPTIRYQPLLGQALVAQLVTPVSVDALGLLYDSSWPAAPLLDLASSYLTPDYDQFYAALDTIVELDSIGALELAAGKSDLLGKPDRDKPVGTPSATGPGGAAAPSKPSSGGENNSLIVYLRPFHPQATRDYLGEKRRVIQLWVRLLRIYHKTQPPFGTAARDPKCTSLKLSVDNPEQLKDWDVNIGAKTEDQLEAARSCLPNRIELRFVSTPPTAPGNGGRSPERAAANPVGGAPLMRTYSALGILKAATERPHPKVEFVTPARYRQIRDPATHGWNGDQDSASYYILLPEDEDSIDCSEAARKQRGGCDFPDPGGARSAEFIRINTDLTHWLAESVKPSAASGAPTAEGDPYHGLFVYEEQGRDVLADRYLRINERLGSLRRYMLIVVDDVLPSDPPYVAYSYNGRWYYIAGDDAISKKNFQLLSLFLTMMAVPPSTQPLSPVINVGG